MNTKIINAVTSMTTTTPEAMPIVFELSSFSWAYWLAVSFLLLLDSLESKTQTKIIKIEDVL